jgi:hypothetical protein
MTVYTKKALSELVINRAARVFVFNQDQRHGCQYGITFSHFGCEGYTFDTFGRFAALPIVSTCTFEVYTAENPERWFELDPTTPADLSADRIFLVPVVGTLESMISRGYRQAGVVINDVVLRQLPTAARRWAKESGYLDKKNRVKMAEGCRCGADLYEQERADEQKALARAKRTATAALRAYEAAKQKAAEDAEMKKAEERVQKAAQKAAEKHEKEMDSHVDGGTYVGVLRCTLREGENLGEVTAQYAAENGVTCREVYDRYSRTCKWNMVRRSFALNIRKGYRVRDVAGVLTFYRGKFNRQGMPCEWVEQGRAIADLHTVKGYLVRGEHIQAKSLAEAKNLNAEKRARQTLDILNKRAETAEKKAALADYMFTFADSLAAGNCRPGTQSFKSRVEAVEGHEVDSISLADLDKYGKLFKLQCYTDRVINYVIAHM